MSRVSSLFYLYCVHALYPPTLLVNGIKWVYLHICVLGTQLALLMFCPRCPLNYLIYTYIFVITMESSFFTKLHKVCQIQLALLFFCLHLIYTQYTYICNNYGIQLFFLNSLTTVTHLLYLCFVHVGWSGGWVERRHGFTCTLHSPTEKKNR